jgi:preprotein translocase subunit YajC
MILVCFDGSHMEGIMSIIIIIIMIIVVSHLIIIRPNNEKTAKI